MHLCGAILFFLAAHCSCPALFRDDLGSKRPVTMSHSSRRWSVNILTEAMFPGIGLEPVASGRPPRPALGAELVASLPLQMCLYFNILYLPCWSAVLAVVFHAKLDRMDFLNRYIYVTVVVGALLMEAARLYVGYMGSLREDVPDLAGFWLITLLLACPLHGLLLLNRGALQLAPELAVLWPQAVFVTAELVLGYAAARRLAQHQVSKFHAASAARQQQKSE
ncbi:transmembrane protein 17-like isoform X2 [Amphibalanus amphitrite]|uniref:transmembrane protein 17-like isoform X2 n=1 Tax=Amphibalanus amphitrite TaxID=1232801 RepID=UPI001C912757|nr:transmembrane protein 17-like isoform X2 [Amphibalanus amphitrite]